MAVEEHDMERTVVPVMTIIELGDVYVDRVGHLHEVIFIEETRVQLKKMGISYKELGWPIDREIKSFWLKYCDVGLLEKVT